VPEDDFLLLGTLLPANKLSLINCYDTKKPKQYQYEIKICPIDDICKPQTGVLPLDKEVFAKEVLITTNLISYNPRKLRLFIWLI